MEEKLGNTAPAERFHGRRARQDSHPRQILDDFAGRGFHHAAAFIPVRELGDSVRKPYEGHGIACRGGRLRRSMKFEEARGLVDELECRVG